MRVEATLFVFVAAIAGQAACSGVAGGTDGGEDAAPDQVAADADTDAVSPFKCSGASPSFKNDVGPVINTCGGEICHGGFGASAWPYSALVNVHASRDTCSGADILVVPGSLEKSYFMNKLTGVGMCAGTQRMPIGNPFSDAKIQLVADWICQGAQNN